MHMYLVCHQLRLQWLLHTLCDRLVSHDENHRYPLPVNHRESMSNNGQVQSQPQLVMQHYWMILGRFNAQANQWPNSFARC